VLTTPHAARRLHWRGFARAVGLRTWTTHEMVVGETRLRVTALPGRHAPGVLQQLLPPVMGSMLEFGPLSGPVLLRLYISGDTLLVEELREIPRRFSDIHAAVLHLGGTRLPGGVMVTMDGRQGADLLELVDAGVAIPIHYDDYTRFRSPLADFRREVDRRGLQSRVRFVDRGQTVDLTTEDTPLTSTSFVEEDGNG
jgi:L-ascorbate metabolism protein UlaG (beta-lactamase superfamily)